MTAPLSRMGNSLPWLPWYHRDFLAATQGWTLFERGAYFMLLGAQWEMGPLPADPRRLAAIIGAQLKEFESVWPSIRMKFAATDAGLVNLRLEDHRAVQLEKSEQASRAARTRWNRDKANGHDASASADAYASASADAYADAIQAHMRKGMHPDPEPDPEKNGRARGLRRSGGALKTPPNHAAANGKQTADEPSAAPSPDSTALAARGMP
jgi:uncharacterized protein YdaU (DUF1376 family)